MSLIPAFVDLAAVSEILSELGDEVEALAVLLCCDPAVAADMRALGLGRLLAQEALTEGIARGLTKLTVRMTIDQRGAIAVFEELGFRGEALLKDMSPAMVSNTISPSSATTSRKSRRSKPCLGSIRLSSASRPSPASPPYRHSKLDLESSK